MVALYICYDGILDDLGQTQVLPYIFGLHDKGYKFIIFSIEKHDRTREEFLNQKHILSRKGILWYHLVFYPRKYNRFIRIIMGPLKLNSIFRKHKIDLVHLRSINAGILYLFSGLRKPYVYDMRCIAGQFRDFGLIKSKMVMQFINLIEKILIKKSKGIVVMDKSGKDYLQNNFKINAPIQIIPTSTYVSKFRLQEDSKIVDNEEIKFVFLGSAEFPYLPKKALEFLLFLYENNIKFTLDIINRRHHKNIENIIKEINFPRDLLRIFPLNSSEIFEQLPNYDCGFVFIQKGNWIKMSSPTKIGEYLAAGLHIIGLEGIEVLDRLSSETESVDVLPEIKNYKEYELKKILTIIKKIRSKNRREEAIKIAEKNYDINLAIQKYQTLYSNIIFK